MASLCGIFLFLALSLQTIPGSESKTVYEILQEYDFPIGILPKGVTGYDLDTPTGEFLIYFKSTCSFKIDSYELKYNSTVTGVLTKDKLSSLSGIRVKVVFMWLNIVKVTRIDDELEFSVGIASANFPVTNFDESPNCGCGFNCEGAKVDKTKLKGLVSSC